jgi:hypothetical protein
MAGLVSSNSKQTGLQKGQQTAVGLKKTLLSLLHTSSITELLGSAEHPAALVVMDLARKTTPETALSSPKVFQVVKNLGESELRKIVAYVLKHFNDSANLANPMNALQIIETANAFIDTYSRDSVDDLILCLKNAKAGKYGPIYNRLDQSVILGFYARYQEEKAQYLESKHLSQKAAEASDVLGIFKHLPEETRKRLMEKPMESLPVEHNTSALFSESAYRELILTWMEGATDEQIEGGITYYMGNGNREYLALFETELETRKRKGA